MARSQRSRFSPALVSIRARAGIIELVSPDNFHGTQHAVLSHPCVAKARWQSEGRPTMITIAERLAHEA